MISEAHKGEKTIILPLSVDYICCCCMNCIIRQLTKRDTLSFSEEGKIDSGLKHWTSCHCHKWYNTTALVYGAISLQPWFHKGFKEKNSQHDFNSSFCSSCVQLIRGSVACYQTFHEKFLFIIYDRLFFFFSGLSVAGYKVFLQMLAFYKPNIILPKLQQVRYCVCVCVCLCICMCVFVCVLTCSVSQCVYF